MGRTERQKQNELRIFSAQLEHLCATLKLHPHKSVRDLNIRSADGGERKAATFKRDTQRQ